MNAVTIKQAKQGLEKLIQQVNSDIDSVIIGDETGNRAVLISLSEFESWRETLYLLSNPANAEHLRQSIEEHRNGKVFEKELIDL